MKPASLRICGLAAVRARFAREPGSIQRLFFDYPRSREVGIMSKVLARERKVYRCVPPEELEKIAGTVHHGGIVAVVDEPPLRTIGAAEVRAWAQGREPLLLLDRIGNAHNLGAIARTAAFFGVPRIIIPDHPRAARPNDAAYRVAEGGLEHVDVWLAQRLSDVVLELVRAGYEVAGAATRGGKATTRRERSKAKPVVLCLGNEEDGLDPEVLRACSVHVTVPGSGKIESLNVSAAAAVLMWELLRAPR